jgi:thioredoxin 1
MKKIFRAAILLIVAAFITIGIPYIKTPCDCGSTIPLALTGSLLGCGGEKEPVPVAEKTDTGTAVASENMKKADTANKTEFKVTFVELGSVNCIPCRMMKPVMDKIEQKYPGQVKVVFHDVWTEEGKSAGFKFAVRVIPTQVFLDKTGKEYFRHEGFFPFEEVDKILKQKGVK